MIKFLLGVAIVAFTSYCGHLFTKKYRKRKLFFKQFKEFNERFLSEIAYYRRPLKQFIASYTYQDAFQDLLTEVFKERDNPTAIQRLLYEDERFFFLKEDEKRIVEDYFLMLGRGDSTSQKSYFSTVKERLSTLQTATETDAKKYGDLYLKLGFLCGLLILILIV